MIWAFGETAVAFSLLNVAFHVGAVLLVRRVLLDRDAALADGVSALAIVYPPLLTATGLVLQESLVSLLLALLFLAAWRALEAPSVGRSLGAGAALGLSGLAKVVSLPLVVSGAVALARVGRPSLRRGAAFVLGAGLVLAPWAVRNKMLLGRFEVTNANGGLTVLGGTASNEIVDWGRFPEYLEARERWERGDRARHPVLDRYLYVVALERIAANPLRWARLVAERAVRFMLPARHWFVQKRMATPGVIGPWTAVGIAAQATLFLSAAWLAAYAVRRRQPWTLLVGPVIVFGHMAVYAASYVSPRYNVTVGPVLFGTLALAVSQRRRLRSSSSR